MGPPIDTIRQRRAEFVQTIQQALTGFDEHVAEEIAKVDQVWGEKYQRMQKDLTSDISKLEAKLKRTEEERNALRQENTELQIDAHNESVDLRNRMSRETDQKTINGLNESLAKARERYDTVRGQLNNVVKIAQTRKEQIVGWIKYADSLEAKIQRLEKKRGRQSAGGGLLSHTEPVAAGGTGGTRSTTPNMPPTPVTVEKPRPMDMHGEIEVEKPSMSASFSSSSSSFLGMVASFDDAINAAPEAGRTDKDATKATAATAATAVSEANDSEQPELPQRASSAGNEGQSNEPTLDSTQGDPSSDGSPPELPELPTPRAATDSSNARRHTYIKEEPSSDGPEIVWERPVKRSRTDDRSSTPSNSRSMVPPAVKRERDAHVKSTPLASIAHYRESQESIDLDEGQLTVPTPRKRQLYLEQLTSEREKGRGREREREFESGSSSGSMSSIPPIASATTPLPTAPAPLAPSTPLASVSVNIRRQRDPKDPNEAMKSLKRGIESVAEDNQGYSTPSGTPRRGAMEPPLSTGRPSRLNSLLNSRPAEPSPVVSASISASASASASASSRHSSSKRHTHHFDSPLARSFQLPPPRLLPHQRSISTHSPKTLGAAAASNSKPRELATPKATPLTAALNAARAEIAAIKSSATKTAAGPKTGPALRTKAMEILKMDDFKINPAANNGDTFAYNEVVRGRTDRANLAGCTDPQCCGKVFRGMATSELDAAGRTHIDRPEGVSLMERYLGDEAYRLAEMTLAQKRELWVEARTRELADKYGKHRHRYHRRASPPGFWDTDFPTTQEEAYNQAEAEKVERLTVQERYREAMKPGGRWLFRDE